MICKRVLAPQLSVCTHILPNHFSWGGCYLYHLDAIIWSCSNHTFPSASLSSYWAESTQHTCCENEVLSITKIACSPNIKKYSPYPQKIS